MDVFHRRTLLLGGSALTLSADAAARTFDYKTVGSLKIKADVYSAGDNPVRPVLVWIHGGALINGHRESVPANLKHWAQQAGYVLVSIDYRLAPETKLPEIIEDVEDAFVWIRREGPRLFKADPKKIAVAGGSAGGYLTLMTGFRAKPKPVALLSLWGYGDIIGDWYSTPSPHPRHHQSRMTREQAYEQVSGPQISDSRDRKGNGGAFYQYCRQTGTWPQAVSGWDPKKEAARFRPFMPVRNVTADYPPTIMIHGTADTDVPYEQSVMMAREFKKFSVTHELISIPGAEHGLSGGNKNLIEASYRKAFTFLETYFQQA
jgi:acetyl esterase/lipase